jgi:predicted transcriptional regulator
MDDKAILIDTIKKWIKLDNEYKQLSSELSKRRKLKKELNSTLIDIMKKNDIDNIDTKDGTSIIYSSKIVKKPITKKVLSDILAKFYNNDLDKASQLNDFILDNRESEIKETITRK